MTLRKRLDRLEGANVKPVHGLCAIVREVVKPRASGPELVAMMMRPLHGGDVVQSVRNPGEGETAFRARFAAMHTA